MVVDISGISYFMPIIGFLFVFLVVYAVLLNTKILGENKFINSLVALVVASIFAVASSAQEYLQTVVPWFGILIVSLFLILIIIGITGKKTTEVFTDNTFIWGFIIILIIIFVISSIKVFPVFFGDTWNSVRNFMTTEARVAGTVLLLIVGLIVAWIVSPASPVAKK